MRARVADTSTFELPKPALEVMETGIRGCVELQPRVLGDARGHLLKVFHEPLWSELGLATDFKEEYYSRSVKNVIRGFHFQVPPMQHAKVVFCVHGEVLDVAVDLRKGSATFGKYYATKLSQQKGNLLYLPEGMAHGFCTLSDDAVLYYKVTTVYSPQHDGGVRWDSVGMEWPVENPILSERDQKFPPLADFESPFTYA